jgi:hypothetical protein
MQFRLYFTENTVFSITKKNRVMFFRKITTIYCDIYIKDKTLLILRTNFTLRLIRRGAIRGVAEWS